MFCFSWYICIFWYHMLMQNKFVLFHHPNIFLLDQVLCIHNSYVLSIKIFVMYDQRLLKCSLSKAFFPARWINPKYDAIWLWFVKMADVLYFIWQDKGLMIPKVYFILFDALLCHYWHSGPFVTVQAWSSIMIICLLNHYPRYHMLGSSLQLFKDMHNVKLLI